MKPFFFLFSLNTSYIPFVVVSANLLFFRVFIRVYILNLFYLREKEKKKCHQ